MERVCFSYSWQDRSLTSRKAVLLLRDMSMGNWEQEWIFLRLRRIFRLHTCPDRVSDHRAWTGKSRQLLEGSDKSPAGALCAKGT